MAHVFKKGEVVKYWFDTGAVGVSIVLGVVTKAGPKSFDVRWESGNTNRAKHTEPRGILPTDDPELIAEAKKSRELSSLLSATDGA